MDVDDGSFDASTPDSEEEEAQTQQNAPARQQRTRPGDRVIRRRARKACVECHKRKVRCDVLSRGSVCTNCRLDGLQCVLRATEGYLSQLISLATSLTDRQAKKGARQGLSASNRDVQLPNLCTRTRSRTWSRQLRRIHLYLEQASGNATMAVPITAEAEWGAQHRYHVLLLRFP